MRPQSRPELTSSPSEEALVARGFSAGLVSAAQSASKVGQFLRFAQSIAADDSVNDVCCRSSRAEATEVQLLGQVRQRLSEGQSRLLSDDFLSKCLAQHHGRVAGAAAIAKGFLSFRHSVRWPLRIPGGDVLLALRTDMHWLLPARSFSSMHQPARWTSGGGDELGPAACLVYNASKLDPSVCSLKEYQKMGIFLVEHATDGVACQERGVALVLDCGGVELTPMLRIMGLEDIRRGVLMWKGAFPCRLRRLWIIDAPCGSQAISSGILRLLAPKVRERVRFAYRSEQGQCLRDVVADLGSRFVLPPSLGGRAGEFDWSCEVDRLVRQTPPASRARAFSPAPKKDVTDVGSPEPDGWGLWCCVSRQGSGGSPTLVAEVTDSGVASQQRRTHKLKSATKEFASTRQSKRACVAKSTRPSDRSVLCFTLVLTAMIVGSVAASSVFVRSMAASFDGDFDTLLFG